MIPFESTTSLLRKLTRDFLVFWNCFIGSALITFFVVILIENAPKRRILCVRENPVNTFVVSSLICLCSYVAYIANNMDPDQTAPFFEREQSDQGS